MLNSAFDSGSNDPQMSKPDLNEKLNDQLKPKVNNESFSLDEHCHVGSLDQNTNKIFVYRIIAILILCFVCMICQIVGGVWADSLSIEADAAHMATEIFALCISLITIYASKKEPTRRMTFGYHRSEVLGAFANVFILWILITILVSIAIKRIVYGNFTINPVAMLITASFGIIFNMVVFVILNTNLCFGGRLNLYFTNEAVIHSSSCKHHGHHANGSGFNIGLRAMVIHFIGDFIQSIGVLIAAIIIYYRPDWKLADPICTFIFAILIILTTVPIFKDIYIVLMEAFPSRLNYNSILTDLQGLNDVKSVHNLHAWSLTMDKYVLAVHLVIERNLDTQKTLKDANNLLRSKYKIDRTIIQVEYFVDGMDSCSKCQLPKSD